MGRFIDLRTDFGFKRLFGQEDSKDILAQFLFDVLALPHPIQELSFIPPEQLPRSPEDRRGIYDVYCVDTMVRRFIVEMQQGHQVNIKERALFYSTFAITYQAQRGADWQFNLLPVYCIAILDFVLIDDDTRYLRRIELLDVETKETFYEKFTLVFIELAKFNRPLSETSPVDKWIYLLKYMPELQSIPAELAQEPFTTAFAVAEEAALSPEERWLYEGSLKQARDINARLASACRDERIAIARSMLARGLEPQLILELTGLSEADLKLIQEQL